MRVVVGRWAGVPRFVVGGGGVGGGGVGDAAPAVVVDVCACDAAVFEVEGANVVRVGVVYLRRCTTKSWRVVVVSNLTALVDANASGGAAAALAIDVGADVVNCRAIVRGITDPRMIVLCAVVCS